MTPWTPPVLRDQPATARITPQQANVLSGLCCGHTYAEIARRCGMSLDTAKTHSKRLFATLGARNRAHAVALACSGQVVVQVAARPASVPVLPRAWERAS